jgi:hypothetical protein
LRDIAIEQAVERSLGGSLRAADKTYKNSEKGQFLHWFSWIETVD